MALLSSTKITPSGPNGGTSIDIDTTGAKLIVFAAASRFLFAPTPSDNLGNDFAHSRVAHIGDPGIFVQNVIWAVFNPITSTTHNFSIDGGAGGGASASATITVWSDDLSLGSVADTTGYSATSPVQPGALTAGRPGSLYITSLSISASTSAPTIDSSFTLQETVLYDATKNYGNAQAYYVQGAAAALNPSWTEGGSPNVLLTTMAVFEPSASDTLVAAHGSFTETGESASFIVRRGLLASPGIFVLTGRPANLPSQPHAMVCATGHFVLTGEAATLNKVKLLVCDTGHFVLTGEDAMFDTNPTWDPACDCDLLTDPWSKVSC